MQSYYRFIFSSKKRNKFISFYLILKLFIFRRLSFLEKKFYKKYLNFNKSNLDFKLGGKYTQDWFSYNIKYIARALYKYNYQNKNLNILEIGCYEGLSTLFFLSLLKNSKVTCVDPFADFEENKDKNFDQVYENFLFNTKKYYKRVKLFKGTSDDYFKNSLNESFDLIYIDGSHYAENVFRDANNSYKYLKKGGIIIFDDFLWDYYKDPNMNPIGGIKKFLSKYFFSLKIISISYQIIIMKI
tara:strand:+ start:951 stop:1676 length:726 start_codon:yes stop_codon:yes gene_type:complete